MKAVISILFRYKLHVLGLMVFGVVSCNSQKKTMMNRVMQNVTAHYNILFNAKELINASEENIKNAHQDNFDQLISVYKEPEEKFSQVEIKNLDNAIFKLNGIVNDKFQSKYVDDAYFLIAKANYLKSNFFNAIEFFNYVYTSYPKENKIKQAALQLKARSLIQLNQLAEAESIIDSALKYKDTEKRAVSDIYAVQTQLHVYSRQYPEAIATLENAIKFSKTKQNRIRWKYLLAQLQDITGQTEAAYKNYSSVMKSNTSFDMAFNASLNRIRMQGDQEGKKVDKVKKLKALLKDDKNIDFIDQIHFRIGNIYEGKNETDKAIESYNTAIRKSTRNQTQKGMAYLKLAEIYFNQADFVKSKTYYDSTLTALPQNHPDYKQISRKGNNLELVANRLNIISTEDSLQALAKLPEAEREIKIALLVRNNEEKELSKAAEQAGNNTFSGNENAIAAVAKDGKFYFNNATALSQGFSEFKRRWGNRKLEDNWRRSQRTSADIVNANLANQDSVITTSANKDSIQKQNSDKFKQSLIKSIPLTEDQLMKSDQRVASALFDIGNYYREEMNDSTQA
ncbi:MAG: hypothetical protein WBP45_05230, partial [Daejeonella sp.]